MTATPFPVTNREKPAIPTPVMNREKIRAAPHDTVEAQLPRPEVRSQQEVRPKPKPNRNRWRSRVASRMVYLLESWWEKLPEPRGLILCGEAEFRLRPDTETTVGIGIAYIAPEVAAKTPDDVPWVDGAPALAVEILSHADKVQDVWTKVQEFLDAGVGLVWVVDLFFRTVCVYRPDAEPKLFNVQQELVGEAHLPGFRTAVADIFKA